MKNIFNFLLMVPVFMLSFAGNAKATDYQKANDFIEFARQGNLAQLRKTDLNDIDLISFSMALTASIDSKATKTTAFLLSVHKFNEIELYRPLMKAASEGMLPEVELLVTHGAEIDGFCDGETPLMASVAAGHDHVVRKLLALRAKTELLSEKSGLTAYGIARKMGRLSTMKIKGLKPTKRAQHNLIVWPDFAGVVPYVCTAAALVGGFLLMRGIDILRSRNAPVPQARQRGLVLRVAPDPRSVVARPAAPAPDQRLAMQALARAFGPVQDPFQQGFMMLMERLAASAHFRQTVESFKAKWLAALLGAARAKLEQQTESNSAPAA